MSWNQLPPAHREQLARQLTPRQHDVYVLWLAGCSYDTIANYLNISKRTVREHLKRAQAINRQLLAKDAA